MSRSELGYEVLRAAKLQTKDRTLTRARLMEWSINKLEPLEEGEFSIYVEAVGLWATFAARPEKATIIAKPRKQKKVVEPDE